ncbi:hypothetical protein IGI04_013507 [Brassica rapa subsp. trilocularis]|uniref:Uncharacterized protein n=1 Tax=Brassica rapa subsp. trilocularis TaxID=1813537 RepID=A0ABQ7N925_BRACM|nr:hypothetical protein IGI04_028554 [Brassica rapa subsp. trilocularis]KAG5407388.1 hypothetical protein IGI04_013507 [Brassica rapa subsp. trilocularis]
MTKRPLSKIEIEQIIGAERPRHVAPTSRSGLRERPQWVALRGRSGLRFVSSRHRDASDLGVSLWEVAPRGVALRSGTQRLRGVAPGGRSHARFVQWSPFYLFRAPNNLMCSK